MVADRSAKPWIVFNELKIGNPAIEPGDEEDRYDERYKRGPKRNPTGILSNCLIVAAQRDIIRDVTGRPADQQPQVWALYKEVQDYYDHGMKVPDDVTLLFADDNWGQIRRLPTGDLNRMHKQLGGRPAISKDSPIERIVARIEALLKED